jgi:hypothetical protein
MFLNVKTYRTALQCIQYLYMYVRISVLQGVCVCVRIYLYIHTQKITQIITIE